MTIPKTYVYDGRKLTVSQLALIAGCTAQAMNHRLSHHSAKEAVALGAKVTTGATSTWARTAAKYPYKDQMLTARELSVIAGITRGSMRHRLMTMSAEQAVALGANPDKIRCHPAGKLHKYDGQMMTVRQAAELTGIPHMTLRSRIGEKKTLEQAIAMGMPRPSSDAWRPYVARKPAPAPFAPDSPAVVPATALQTSVAAPRSRLEVMPGEAPPIFSGLGIGRYEATGSAIERSKSVR